MVGGPEVGAVHLHASAHPLDHPEEAALEEHVPEEDLPELGEGEEEEQGAAPSEHAHHAGEGVEGEEGDIHDNASGVGHSLDQGADALLEGRGESLGDRGRADLDVRGQRAQAIRSLCQGGWIEVCLVDGSPRQYLNLASLPPYWAIHEGGDPVSDPLVVNSVD